MRKNKSLGERHQRILVFIREYEERNEFPPSIREIGEKTGITSTSLVNYYLDQLEKMGFVERDRKISRGVRLANKTREAKLLEIPLLGKLYINDFIQLPKEKSDFANSDSIIKITIPAFLLMERSWSYEDNEDFETNNHHTHFIDQSLFFATEIAGNEFADSLLANGDVAILRRISEAKNGMIVLVWLIQEEKNKICRYYSSKGKIQLQPCNPSLKKIDINDAKQLKIIGEVVSSVRLPEYGLSPVPSSK